MKAREQFHLVQYSIQGNHLHLIIEADSNDALARGMISLMTRIARNLNKLFRRVGKFFADRYHSTLLRTPKRVRRTLVYVFGNAWHHGLRIQECMDRYTSAPWFRSWVESVRVKFQKPIECPVEEASSWLLSDGWRNLGRISVFERPA
jgi:REP element-mobilizing transposase RayT